MIWLALAVAWLIAVVALLRFLHWGAQRRDEMDRHFTDEGSHD